MSSCFLLPCHQVIAGCIKQLQTEMAGAYKQEGSQVRRGGHKHASIPTLGLLAQLTTS